MHRKSTLLVLLFTTLMSAKDFSGARALEYTRKAVSFGPRPSGSPAIHLLQSYLLSEVKQLGFQIVPDDFMAKTPNGKIAMRNIIARLPGTSGRALVFTGHYDTKLMPGFVGANDGGSSAGFLLELGAALRGRPHKDDLYLVWFDGEEAFGEWSDSDSLYGSRHLAEKWAKDGTLARVKALINVDMIGDKDLALVYEMDSAESVRNLVWETADRMGYSKNFPRNPSGVGDDHVPFLRQGVKALDLIDFDYGPSNSYWHTTQDTMDKLSAKSFSIVGNVLLAVIPELELQR